MSCWPLYLDTKWSPPQSLQRPLLAVADIHHNMTNACYWLVMLQRGVPEYLRSDNGAEMTAKLVREWLSHRRCADPVL